MYISLPVLSCCLLFSLIFYVSYESCNTVFGVIWHAPGVSWYCQLFSSTLFYSLGESTSLHCNELDRRSSTK